jgi:Spy/CpxP family protein refolding chaperone
VKKWMLAVAVSGLVVARYAAAQEPPPDGAGGTPPGPRPGAGERQHRGPMPRLGPGIGEIAIQRLLDRHAVVEELGLTPEQVKTLKEKATEFENRKRKIREQLDLSGREQVTLLAAEPINTNAVMAVVEKSGKLRTHHAKLAVEELLFIRSTLTAEQLNRMKQIRERWAARAQQRQQEELGGRARRNRRAGEHGVRPPPPPPGAPAAPEIPPEGGPEDLPR